VVRETSVSVGETGEWFLNCFGDGKAVSNAEAVVEAEAER